jgi:hypothetical protein
MCRRGWPSIPGSTWISCRPASSWLNLVERWFRELTNKRLKRGSFAGVPELIAAIEDYIAHNNAEPKPFMWTKTADEIIEKVKRGRVALNQTSAN